MLSEPLLFGCYLFPERVVFVLRIFASRAGARAPAGGPAEHLGRLAPCPPSAVFVYVLSGKR